MSSSLASTGPSISIDSRRICTSYSARLSLYALIIKTKFNQSIKRFPGRWRKAFNIQCSPRVYTSIGSKKREWAFAEHKHSQVREPLWPDGRIVPFGDTRYWKASIDQLSPARQQQKTCLLARENHQVGMFICIILLSVERFISRSYRIAPRKESTRTDDSNIVVDGVFLRIKEKRQSENFFR